jgi:hypothetical protein
VAGAYALIAWLLVQAADILLGNFGAPEWVFNSFVALLLLGFPFAFFLSWAYELTPEGVRLAADVSAETSGSQAGKPIDWLIDEFRTLSVGGSSDVTINDHVDGNRQRHAAADTGHLMAVQNDPRISGQ